MSFRKHATAVLLVAGIGLGLAGCAQADATSAEEADLNGEVAKVELIEGTHVNRVTLSPEATAKLGIKTAPVLVLPVNGVKHTAVLYSAVIYDEHGAAFVYITPQPNVFQRVPVTVTDVGGDLAAVDGAPPVNTQVVSVGASELLGTETGVGDE
jgi:hypothetical protein